MVTAVVSPVTPNEALERLKDSLDLSNIRLKLADSEEGKGYSTEHLDLMEAEYRKFLAMQLAFPGTEIVPCELVDEMWHQHILDTQAYHEDCNAIFGSYLHHYPYFGMRGEDDAQALHDAYAATIERYRAAFGEPPAETWISTAASKCKRTACKPQKCR
jgi:hypothetical protein